MPAGSQRAHLQQHSASAALAQLLLLLSCCCCCGTGGTGGTSAAGGCDIDTVDGSALSSEDFARRYVRSSRPVRLTGLSTVWSGAAGAWSGSEGAASLAARYGDAPLVSRWAEGSYLFGLLLRPVTMASYLDTMAHRRAGLLFNSSRVGEGELWSIPTLVQDAGLTETVISVGPPGRGLSFHNHGSTLEAIVSGGPKHFALIPPISAEAIAKAGDRWSTDLFKRLLLPTGSYRNAELMAELNAMGVGPLQQCTVSPGEAIFIPCNWYHATENLPPLLPPPPPPTAPSQQEQDPEQQCGSDRDRGSGSDVSSGMDAAPGEVAAVVPTVAIAMQWSPAQHARAQQDVAMDRGVAEAEAEGVRSTIIPAAAAAAAAAAA
eukprot:COSAG06_NODE_1273_length_10053_cov_19.602170_1_plen_375_part_10